MSRVLTGLDAALKPKRPRILEEEEPVSSYESRTPDLRAELDQMDTPVKGAKNRILGALMTVAPTLLSGIFGGEDGAIGASEGTDDFLDDRRATGDRRRKELLDEIRSSTSEDVYQQRSQDTQRRQDATTRAADRRARLSAQTRTKTLGDKEYQFNPDTGKYDIEIGPAAPKGSTRQKTLLEEMHDREHPDHPMSRQEYINHERELGDARRKEAGTGGGGSEGKGSYRPIIDANTGLVIGRFDNRKGQIEKIDNPVGGTTSRTPAEMQNRRNALDYIATRVSRLKTLVSKMTQPGLLQEVDVEGVGPLDGRAGSVKAVTTGNTKDVALMRQLVGELSDSELRKRSGAAITEAEYARLKAFLLDVNSADSEFLANLDGWIKAMDEMKKADSGRVTATDPLGDWE